MRKAQRTRRLPARQLTPVEKIGLPAYKTALMVRRAFVKKTGDATLHSWCIDASDELHKMLPRSIFVWGMFRGFDHAWVEYRGWIIDVTATQFGLRQRIHITPRRDPRYRWTARGKSARAWALPGRLDAQFTLATKEA